LQQSRHGKIGSPESEIEQRADELAWVLDNFREIESDFAVFYRIDDVSQLDGVFFFERVLCLFYYQGALRTKLENELAQQKAKEAEWNNRFKGKGSSRSQRSTLSSPKPIQVNGPGDVRKTEFDGLIEFA
jgi:hypothetical protein